MLHARKVIKNGMSNVLVSDVAVDAKLPRGGLLAQLDANLNVKNLSSPCTFVQRAPTFKVFITLPMRCGSIIKPDPADTVIPRKRTSSSLIFLGAENEDNNSCVSTLPISRHTILQLPKALLAYVNSNMQLLQGHIPVQLADQKVVLLVAHQPSLHHSFESNTDPEEDWELPDILGGAGTCDACFDEDGDFYRRGKNLFIRPTVNPGDIGRFFITTGNAEQFDGNASNGHSLLAHQIIDVAWVLECEKCGNNGGCLSDEMGLGKTVQIFSVVIANPSDDPRCKINLIVAPLALLDQWKLKIEMKTTNNLKCLVYHGSNRPHKKTDLMKYNVVLTTYHTLTLEWPDLEVEEKAKQKAQKCKKTDSFIVSNLGDDSKLKKKKRELGLLFQVQWYCVILNEAQNICNQRTTSRDYYISIGSIEIFEWKLDEAQTELGIPPHGRIPVTYYDRISTFNLILNFAPTILSPVSSNVLNPALM
ncbi:SNF2 family N-terminal domain-containing protein [Suillus occidentalis]|nr:SNF2 family N-terminal domain-containing protein [Suillus occidentalis]